MSIFERVQSVAYSLTSAELLLVREVIAKSRDVALGTASSLPAHRPARGDRVAPCQKTRI